jgi:hypothetical protein
MKHLPFSASSYWLTYKVREHKACSSLSGYVNNYGYFPQPTVIHNNWIRSVSYIGILTDWLASWGRVLPEKLTCPHPAKKISRILWNPDVHFRIHKSPTPVPILSQIDPIYAFPHPTSLRSILILSIWSLVLRFFHYPVCTSPLPHTCFRPCLSQSS